MLWLNSFIDWVSDPDNVSELAPSVVIILCTIALIITISASIRIRGKRIVRAIDDADYPVNHAAHGSSQYAAGTGPRRTGSIPVQQLPTPAAHAYARASSLDNDPLNQ